MTDKPTLRQRYNRGYYFRRLTVLRNGSEWLLVGPGLSWLGRGFPTWASAMHEAISQATMRTLP